MATTSIERIMISQPSEAKPSAAVFDKPKTLPFSVTNNVRTATGTIYPEGVAIPQANGTVSSDKLVYIQQSKLQDLIDALLATATALRQNFPQTATDDDLEGGRKAEKYTIGPKKPSFGRNVNKVYDTEDLPKVLETQLAASHILAEEDANAIQEFCQGIAIQTVLVAEVTKAE